MKISEIVAAQRRRLGLKQYELADRTGIAASQISIFERGSSGMVTTNLEKVLEALDLHIVYDRPGYQETKAQCCAQKLYEAGHRGVHNVTREEMACMMEDNDILLFPVVSEELYRRYTRSQIMDETNTWNHFVRLIERALLDLIDEESERRRREQRDPSEGGE